MFYSQGSEEKNGIESPITIRKAIRKTESSSQADHQE